MKVVWHGRLARAAGRYGEHAPMAAVCCNACRTCATTNVAALGLVAVVRRRRRRRAARKLHRRAQLAEGGQGPAPAISDASSDRDPARSRLRGTAQRLSTPAAEHGWHPRRESDPRLAAELSQALTQSRANLFRYPPGAVERRHIDPIQEEVFVVLAER